MLQQVAQVKTIQRQCPTMVSRKGVGTLISSLSYPWRKRSFLKDLLFPASDRLTYNKSLSGYG